MTKILYFVFLFFFQIALAHAEGVVVEYEKILEQYNDVSEVNDDECKFPQAYVTDKNECICISDIRYLEITFGSKKDVAEFVNKTLFTYANSVSRCKNKFDKGRYYLKYSTYMKNKNLFSVYFEGMEDIGIANPALYAKSFNFDMLNNKLLKLEDLFNSKDYAEINKIVVEALRNNTLTFIAQEDNIDEIYKYGVLGFTENGKYNFQGEYNFIIDQTYDITVIFKPYFAGPRSAGFISVDIPKKFIKKEFIE